MGTFRKSLKGGANSRQISENLKKLNKDLKRTESVLNEDKEKEQGSTESTKFSWREEYFPQANKTEDIKTQIANEVESLRGSVAEKRELRHLQKVDKHLAGVNVEFYRLRDELVEQINTDFNLREIEAKLDEVLGVYGKLHQRIDEGLLNEPPESAQNGDPLAPLGQKFVTFEQLRNHYSLFINRISKQMATLGGGGEVNFRYLDDVDWNGADDDGKFLKYNNTTERFEFATVSGGGGGGSIAGIDTTGTSTFTDINVGGRVVGAATSNILPFLYPTISDLPSPSTYHGAFAHVHSTGRAYYAHAGSWIEIVNKELDGVVGTGTETYNVGIVTGATYYGDGSNLTNLPAAGIGTDGSVNTSGIITASAFVGDGSGLTGVTASGTGVIIQEEGSTIGTASTINFVGTSVTATFNSGTATISLTDNVGTAGTGALAGIDTTGQSVFNNINASGIVTSLGGFSGNITGTAGTFTTVSAAGTISATMLYGDVTGTASLALGVTGTPNINVAAIGATSAVFTGVVTAQSFAGDGSGLTGLAFSGDNVFTGITTFNNNAQWKDNKKAVFGDGSDLEVYHDGAGSYISETGDGDLTLNSNGTNINLKFNNSEFGAKFEIDQGVTLYHNGIEKFEVLGGGTTTYGAHYAGSFVGGGSGITGINTSQLTGWENVSIGIGSNTSVVTSGVITATRFSGAYTGDGSTLTGIATPGYVDAAIAGIVSSAPATLDTLNELAAALGDDPNFSTSMTNLIGTKASLAGAAFTGNVTSTGYISVASTAGITGRLYASERVYIGADSALQLSYATTGNPVTDRSCYIDAGHAWGDTILRVRHTNGGSVVISNAGNLKSAVFNGQGSAELYYGDVKKFETSNNGVNIIGILSATGQVKGDTLDITGNISGGSSITASNKFYGNLVGNVTGDLTGGLIGTGNLNATDINALGIVTAAQAQIRNLRIGTFGTNNIFGASGNLYLDSDNALVDIVNNLKVSGVTTFHKDAIFNHDVVGLSSANFTGIVTAQKFVGDGSSLTGIAATLALNDLTDVNAGSPTDGHVLKWDNSAGKWVSAADLTAAGGSGIALTSLSASNGAPAGIATFNYNSSTGVFTYTPVDLSSYLTNSISQNVSMSNGYTFTYDSSAVARFGSSGANNYGDIFWGTNNSTTGLHVINSDSDGGLYLTNTGTGGVFIRYNGELGASFIPNGAANLFYNNVLRLSTTDQGISIAGDTISTGAANFAGIVTSVAGFKGDLTGTASYATNCGVASTSNYATNALVADTAGSAGGLTGTPSVTVDQLNTTGDAYIGAGRSMYVGGVLGVKDNVQITGQSPILKLEDDQYFKKTATLHMDGNTTDGLTIGLRLDNNAGNFKIASEAGGNIGTNFFNITGGNPSNADYGNVGINSAIPKYYLDVHGDARFTDTITGNLSGNATGLSGTPDVILGVTTASKFVGDGSLLTGVTAAGSGVVLQEEGSALGIAATINFVGTGITATVNNGIATIETTQDYANKAGIADNVADNAKLYLGDSTASNLYVDGKIGIGTTWANTYSINATGNARFYGGHIWMPWNSSGSLVMENAHDAYAALYTSGKNHLVIQNSGTLSIGRTTPDGNASVSINGAVSIAGSITGANTFYGDGSGLTGVVASGTGVIIQDEGSVAGTATTLNFVGAGISAVVSSGSATITVSNASQGLWESDAAGIHTTSNAGISTTKANTQLQVGGHYGVESGIGTFAGVAGTPVTIDSFNTASLDFKTAEYTLHLGIGTFLQSQKVLLMQDGTNCYSNEYAVMSSPSAIVSVGSTISSGTVSLQATPVSGINGVITYRFVRGTLL